VAVTNKIAEIKKQLKLNADISDYQKVVNIYNFICNSDMDYDYVHLNDQNYKLQYAVYGALVNKTAVCQGFASLFYRLALEAGVDARLISGVGIDQNGQMKDHAWNIVELNGAYYCVDATWDLSRWDYTYFLKNEKEFADHHCHSSCRSLQEYNTAAASRFPVLGANL
jgi:transglutaminase/protease-like cytokinesis protein 3